MFKILGFLFAIILAILLIGLGIIGSFLMRIFKGGGYTSIHTTHTYRRENGGHTTGGQRVSTDSADEGVKAEEGSIRRPSKAQKQSWKDEGEYVEFEEIKE